MSISKVSRTMCSWDNMMGRCYRSCSPAYDYYGGRGIGVVPEWHSYQNFLASMGERPDNMTLERLDNDKDYGPSNCKWATSQEQDYNKRNTLKVYYKGQLIPLRPLVRELGLNFESMRGKVRRKTATYQEIIDNVG